MQLAANATVIPGFQIQAIQTNKSTQSFSEVSEAKDRPAAPPKFFNNGILDAQGLLSSDLVRDVIALNASGSIEFKEPDRFMTTLEYMVGQEISSRAGEMSTLGMEPSSRLLTDDDRAFFRATTGYNFVAFANGTHIVVDDEGNLPNLPSSELSALGVLGISLMGDRSSGRLSGDVSKDWLQDHIQTYAGSEMSSPESWKSRAEDWFLKRPK